MSEAVGKGCQNVIQQSRATPATDEALVLAFPASLFVSVVLTMVTKGPGMVQGIQARGGQAKGPGDVR